MESAAAQESMLNLIMAAMWLPETHVDPEAKPDDHVPAMSQTNLAVRGKLMSKGGLRRTFDSIRGTQPQVHLGRARCGYVVAVRSAGWSCR